MFQNHIIKKNEYGYPIQICHPSKKRHRTTLKMTHRRKSTDKGRYEQQQMNTSRDHNKSHKHTVKDNRKSRQRTPKGMRNHTKTGTKKIFGFENVPYICAALFEENIK